MRKINLICATGGTLWQSFNWIEHSFFETFAVLVKKYPGDSSIRMPTKEELLDMSHSGRALDDNLAFILGTARPELIQEGHAIYRRIHDTPEGLRAVTPYPDVPQMLRELKAAGVTLFAASEKATEAMLASLDHLGLLPLFSHVQGASGGGQKTTKAAVLNQLVTEAHRQKGLLVDPSQTILLEGRPRGIEQALRESGLLSIGALWGGASPEAMAKAGAAWTAQSPKDIYPLLAGIAGRPEPRSSVRLCPYTNP